MQVAGILISTDSLAKGVAPGASLYSSAHATGAGTIGTSDDLTMRAIQQVATQANVRAVNHSYFKVYGTEQPDGNDLLSAGLDWSAAKNNVLHVTSGNNQASPLDSFSPKANFNGMVIGRSLRPGDTGKYRQYDPGNLIINLEGSRTAIDLLAPGFDVQSTLPNNMLTPNPPQMPINGIDDGASFAAPHVTGTVALLQQYGDDRVAASAANWTGTVASGPTSQRHEVMKAVLMNSADKLEDNNSVLHNGSLIPQGRLLGMERTVLKGNGGNWFDSEAFEDIDGFMATPVPLDGEIGTGHLNAKRALQQFIPGEHDFNGNFGTPIVGDVPLIGWDYGTIDGANFPINKYALDTPLVAGNFISITLAWDREVEFANDANMDGNFDVGDTFQDYTNLDDVLTDLDLYLVPAGTNDVGDDDIAISESTVFPVEHIFTEIPFDGDFEIWVFRNEQFAPAQDYGIAWWYGLAPTCQLQILQQISTPMATSMRLT